MMNPHRSTFLHLPLLLLVLLVNPARAQDPMLKSEVRTHHGRPTVFVNGQPLAMTTYSPAGGWRRELFHQQIAQFHPRQLSTYFINIGKAKGSDFFATPLWSGSGISATPLSEFELPPDEQAQVILAVEPAPYVIVRFGLHEPASWRKLHPDELVVTEEGKRLEVPSLASQAYWDSAAKFAQACIAFSESRPWAHRVIGYANFLRMEGTHEPVIRYQVFDHSPVMTQRWRQFLRERYGAVEKLRQAYRDDSLTFDTVAVPRDRLRGSVPEVSAQLYWQTGADNQALRDYIELTASLFHAGFTQVAAAQSQTLRKLGRQRFMVYDALKQVMLGWDNLSFFDPKVSPPLAYTEQLAGSGHLGVAGLLNVPGVDGLITPHDYQARGIGGVFEAEGIADSVALRGKLMMVEMDTRTWTGRDPIAPARDVGEFKAITWRNIAAALTRGHLPYWMDVYENWFSDEGVQQVIHQQARVLETLRDLPHETPAGIAMVLDDRAVLQTNGDGRYFNEAIMWEWKTGLVRCGVPVRVYLIDDLNEANFPEHRVFYFPNLFHLDDARMKLLREKVLNKNRVVVWGPGSGISDGAKIGSESAAELTGFAFDLIPSNYPRRTLLTNFEHPITRGLSAATVLGGPLAYGPVLLPNDGVSLGNAWTKQGRNASGIAVKDMGSWTSVFTTAPGLPAAMWRNIARLAKAHVYCDTDDVLMASGNLIGLHVTAEGPRTIHLPGPRRVTNLDTNETSKEPTARFEWVPTGTATALYRLENP